VIYLVTDVQLLLIILSTVIGGLFSWLGGWGESGNPFDFNKAYPSWIRIIFAAIGMAIVTATEITGPVTLVTYFLAGLAGFTIDAGINRLSGIVRNNTG
jgi:hypothetical protein